MRRAGRALAALAVPLGMLLGCASTPDTDPRYEPARNVLEVIAVLRRHVPDDTYRFEPARDFTDRNVYRSSLLRLESLQRVHADALRAGHMDGAIAFAKGRALERLRAYDLAAEEYRLAAERDPALAAEALHSADVCGALDAAAHLGVEIVQAATEGEGLDPSFADTSAVLAAFDDRVALLEDLERSSEGSHYAFVAREELERADVARARYFLGLRQALPEGDVRAVSELQRVVLRHGDSKNANRHLIELADLYADLAVEYAGEYPPEGLHFDPVRFRELIDSAARLYEMVANRDGAPEKLEATRRLEAFLAFALAVDRDRFTP